jgi:hypothetical protein
MTPGRPRPSPAACPLAGRGAITIATGDRLLTGVR